MGQEEEAQSLALTPTWVVAAVCLVIVTISLGAECLLHRLGKLLKYNGQEALFSALQRVKEELMLLGFISFLLSVFQNFINHIIASGEVAVWVYFMANAAATIFFVGVSNKMSLFSVRSGMFRIESYHYVRISGGVGSLPVTKSELV